MECAQGIYDIFMGYPDVHIHENIQEKNIFTSVCIPTVLLLDPAGDFGLGVKALEFRHLVFPFSHD